MAELFYKNDFLDKFFSDFTSRIVSETGIPSDRHHLGKIILKSLKEDPDFVLQIDGSTGQSETNGSVLRRSIQCATIFRVMGLKTGDVIVLMAPHHLDQAIPFYAALFLGIAIAPIDRMLGVNELQGTFNIRKPKIVFCQSEKVQDVQEALNALGSEAKIISFDKSDDVISFAEIMEERGGHIDVDGFKAADFDSEETVAFLISTSGTTGLPKAVAVTHRNLAFSATYMSLFAKKTPPVIESVLIVAPLQWLSALICYLMSPFLKFARIQSPLALTPEHVTDIIITFKPKFLIISPTMMITLVKEAKRRDCDFSTFEVLFLGGSAVPKSLVEELKILSPNAIVVDAYGFSEAGSLVFNSIGSPLGSCGIPLAHMQYRLVNTDTGEEINEPNQRGELWLKIPGGFKGYYNDPAATAEAITKDQWFMTGDIMYRDENWNFYFVERLKLLLKYRNHQISPVELEDVIRQHPGVLDVAVTGLPDLECGDLPVACVIPKPGTDITAQNIQDLVKEKLSDTKQLRGGVFFFKELPLTPSTKLHRRKLKEMVLERSKEQDKTI